MPIRNSIRHYLARPYYGSRRMAAWLATQGHHVNRKWVQRLMRLLGSVTLAWRAQLEPGTAYYWNDIPIPPELVRDRKLYGRARLTAVLRPLVSPFGGANYFASRLETSLRYPNGSGSFLAYLAKCAVTGQPDTVFGYDGKQVRDNIHSWDLVNAFCHFAQDPRAGAVYNVGGGRHANCSMLEAISVCGRLTGRPINWSNTDQARTGDHIWWISDVRRFQSHYPRWRYRYDIEAILAEVVDAQAWRLRAMGG